MKELILVNNNGGIFAEIALGQGFWELEKVAARDHFDYIAAEIRLHPSQKPMLVDAATEGTIDGEKFAGMSIVVDPSMKDDEMHVRDVDGKLLIRITNLGKIRGSGENNA